MKAEKKIVLSLVIAAVVWGIFSWPLPRYLFSGVSYGVCKFFPTRLERDMVTRMRPGDHLQLMYHFWLFRDQAVGQTSLFHNLYEFNCGEPDEHFRTPSSYYFPFSLIYALGSLLLGHAFGWNLAGFISIWLGYLFTWLLLSRYGLKDPPCALLGLPVLMFPFLWLNLSGGSPAGFAMCWTPLLMLGIEDAVMRDRATGGVVAGLAVVLAQMGDTHVFFFSVLLIPGWCVITILRRQDMAWKSFKAYRKLALALLPIPLLTLLAYLMYQACTGAIIAHSDVGSQRMIQEVAKFSPQPIGLFSWFSDREDMHIYLGLLPCMLGLASLFVVVMAFFQDGRAWRRAAIVLLLLLGLAVIVFLALGVNGPWNYAFLSLARKLIPPYRMIRQPAKIFCLLPYLLPVIYGLGYQALRQICHLPDTHVLLVGLAGVMALHGLEYKFQIRNQICLLDSEQQAYASVAADAARNRQPARIMVVPLWPGESHYSAEYQYYAMLYRIMMVNGYCPVVPHDYRTKIFEPFKSVNLGLLDDAQKDELLAHGIHYILLHEDVYPEKVSPFFVGFALHNLLEDQRLQLLRQDRGGWAFKILPQGGRSENFELTWNHFFPTRNWEVERGKYAHADSIESDAVGCSVFLRMNRRGWLRTPLTQLQDGRVYRWAIRLRGHGELTGKLLVESHREALGPLQVATNAWVWRDLPFRAQYGKPLGVELLWAHGEIDVDLISLRTGPDHVPAPGETAVYPATAFSHAGYTDQATQSVCIDTDHTYSGRILMGPRLPYPPGRYTVELDYATDAPDGVELGELNAELSVGVCLARWPILAGQPLRKEFTLPHNLPLTFNLHYFHAGNMTLRSIRLTREQGAGGR